MLSRLLSSCANLYPRRKGSNGTPQHSGKDVQLPTTEAACGALALIAQFNNVPVSSTALQNQIDTDPTLASDSLDSRLKRLQDAAATLDLHCHQTHSPLDTLRTRSLPIMAIDQQGAVSVIAAVKKRADGTSTFLVHDPLTGKQHVRQQHELEPDWTGITLEVRKTAQAADSTTTAPFGFSWFWQAMMKHRRTVIEVMVAASILHVFSLMVPLFFQVVMDKVLAHEGYTTLNVLGMGLAAILLFDALIGGLRHYLYAHTATRIDNELGSTVFSHLMRLPMGWFNARTTGQSVANVRELDAVRQFITGSAVTLVVDLVFTTLFFFVLYLYSPTLTLVVAASVPVYFALTLLVTPIQRRFLAEKYKHSAKNQSFLVEAVSGIETLKSQSADAHYERRWNAQQAEFAEATFKAQTISGSVGEGAKLINKLTTLAIIWVGALEVMAGSISVGQLVAFNMIASRVSAPILKLAQLWQDFQQAGLSVKRLADVLDAPAEPAVAAAATPTRLKGHVSLDKVSFRYRPDSEPVLRQISFSAKPGEVIGIVGASGSGKSTLAKLLQRLHLPQNGQIRLDGKRIESLPPRWLRRQVGRVEQDSVLFSGTVHENIALACPAATRAAVEHAARLAGAHEFIEAMQNGYDSQLDERGGNLSGGQRQRIALARSLVANPAILILDEATSSLDVESEHAIQRNMHAICAGRTVIIIAHRLSAVRQADRILVMHEGLIVEQGHHDELVAQGGRYAALLARQQTAPPIRRPRTTWVDIEVSA